MKRRAGNYAAERMPPRTLTPAEQKRLLDVSGKYSETFRDHVIFSVALGTGLREAEVAALDLGDLYDTRHGIKVRRRILLRSFKGKIGPQATQQAFIPDQAVQRLRHFWHWKRIQGEGMGPDDPVFVVKREGAGVASWRKRKGRISTRTLRNLCAIWSRRAGFDQPFNFHQLRHTSLTNLYRATGGDIRKVQIHARHADITSTMIYTHPSDAEMLDAVRRLPS